MLKFARKSRASSVERQPASPPMRTSSLERQSEKLTSKIRDGSVERHSRGQCDIQKVDEGHCDYETVYSGTFCRLSAPPTSPVVPMTPTVQRISSQSSQVELKSVLKKKFCQSVERLRNPLITPLRGVALNPGYDFHRAIEKLVEKMDLNIHDTSSESGYGSDQDSLNSNNSQETKVQQEAPTLPPRGSPRPPIPPKSHKSSKRVQFDSYVLFLQGIRERDPEMVELYIQEVCEAALTTDEVVAEFQAAVIEGQEPIVKILLAKGFPANVCPGGMTPLHLAAAFNNLPLVRLLLSYGAGPFARAHSSGKTASELCSRNLPGFQACHAYLRCMEECLGVANSGRVFSTQNFRTAREDELNFEGGEELVVVRKGDYSGSNWWWCRNQSGLEGYVLQDLLSLNRRP